MDKVVVENNSLSGDKARAAVKESAEQWKEQVRETLGEGSLSQLVNGTINALADSGDAAIGSADYAADAAMALTACAMGDSYCTKAMSDLAGKNQAVADSVSALMNGDTWEGIKTLAQKANEGDQLALEGMGGLMAGILVPGKKIPDVGAIIDIGKAEVTSGKLASGAENIATYPKLKDELIQQNLNNIAKQDPRLAEAVKGSGSTNPNFGS